MSNENSSISVLSSRLHDTAPNQPLIVSGQSLDCAELNDLLGAMGLTELSLSGAKVERKTDQISVVGGGSLFGIPGVTICTKFTAGSANALSVALHGSFPADKRLKIAELDWASIGELFLDASVTGPSLLVPVVSITLGGTFQIKGQPKPITVTVGQSVNGWVLRAADIPIPDPDAIASFLCGNKTTLLPPQIDLKGFSIVELLCRLRPDFTPDSVTLMIGAPSKEWDLTPGLSPDLKIKKFQLYVGLTREGALDDNFIDEDGLNGDQQEKLTRLSASLGATLAIKPLELPVRIAYAGGEWRMGIFGAHGFPSFGDLVKQVGGSDAAAMLPDGLKGLRIDEASVELTLGSGSSTIRSLYFAVKLADWPIVDNVVSLKRSGFEFTVDRVGGGITGFVTGAICLGDDVEISVTAEKESKLNGGNEWQFTGATGPGQEISIGKLIKVFDKNAEPPPVLSTVSIENLSVSFNTASKRFTFTCEGKLSLGDSGPKLSCKVNIDIAKDSKTFAGTITIGAAEFTFDIKSDQATELDATWKYDKNLPRLELTKISDGLPDLSDLQTFLLPESASLKLNLKEGERKLSLDCATGAVKLAFLLAQDSRTTPPRWIAALGLKPGKISTADIGPLGSALQPHSIALDKLVVVAANADAPKDFQLTVDGKGAPFTKGLFLKGELKFEQTSFSYPFECNLGGQKPQNKLEAPAAGGDAEKPARADDKTPEVKEGNNNVKVGRTIGPVTFRKARFESRDESGKKRVYVLLDASLGSAGFDLDLDGFNVNFPLDLPLQLAKDPKDLTKLSEIGVGLDGLSISYSNPPLTISGGFARTTPKEPYIDYLYEGHLLIKAEAFQIAVLGSYGTIFIDQAKTVKRPSLFVYGMYNGVVGGPAAFFVTGLALGGGYNTRLQLPPVEEVATFPLVQAVTDPTKFQSEALRQIVLPSYGDYWLALGIKFTSFKMADSFALFSVAFGNRLQFALLGLTKFTVPTGAEEGKCAVYAELQIRAVLDPDAGVFSIEGRLTNNSYVFTKDIRLTGGFAFFVWFGNAKEAGDFVISLGGYHPDFLPPAHYPVVPRIGIRGQLSDALTVAGEAYFALTPSCLMAGIKLAAVFEYDIITAAFVAYADFIVAWAPFHYDARIGMGIAVTIRLARSFKLEISADLHVWGPPFAGTAHVSFWIASFTIKFGDTSGTKPDPLEWGPFQNAFLPKVDPKANHALLSTIRITEGLVREVKRESEAVTYRIVNPHELMIETDSAVPCSEISVGKANHPNPGTAKIGIRPMAATKLDSIHAVNIVKIEGKSPVEEKFKPVQWSEKNFPKALWSPESMPGHLEADNMISKVPSGVVLRVQPTAPQYRLGPFPIKIFEYEPVDKKIPWATAPKAPDPIDPKFITVSKENPLRDQIRDCLVKHATKPGTRWNEIAMTNTSDNPKDHFQAPPTCAALGQSLRGARHG